MTPQERDLTTILLDRLSKTEGQPKDTEAETLIRDTTAERPDAPYSLVQTVLIQDLSLHDAQIKITGLETKADRHKVRFIRSSELSWWSEFPGRSIRP
jgi:uncharacterized protein